MAVQYVKFPLGDSAFTAFREPGVELSLGVEHPAYRAEVVLGPRDRRELAGRLRVTRPALAGRGKFANSLPDALGIGTEHAALFLRS